MRGDGDGGGKYLNQYGQNLSRCNENYKPAYLTNSMKPKTNYKKITL